MNVSAGAMREEYQTRFGEEFAAIYYALRNDWAAGLWRLGEYRELFGDAENVELLNATGDGGFIGEIQQILRDDLMMRLCRLTESLNSAGKANLTVRRLPEFCTDQELRAEVGHQGRSRRRIRPRLEKSANRPYGSDSSDYP